MARPSWYFLTTLPNRSLQFLITLVGGSCFGPFFGSMVGAWLAIWGALETSEVTGLRKWACGPRRDDVIGIYVDLVLIATGGFLGTVMGGVLPIILYARMTRRSGIQLMAIQETAGVTDENSPEP